MSHSNSSLNCFTDCMAKYNHRYILHTPPCKPPSEHLAFGTMAHEVLYKAGRLRDDTADGVVTKDDYYSVIPSEVDAIDLKNFFVINNWQRYFTAVIKQTAEYEQQCIDELKRESGTDVLIEREVKLQFTSDELAEMGYYNIKQSLVGIIDLLLYTPTHAIILDYKFSSNRKTQDDFDMDSQLPLYATLVSMAYDIPVHNIQYGYIDIPKQDFGQPVLLSNGTLSRSKSQNLSADMYEKAVVAIHGDDPTYNCKPGGYYYECYRNLKTNKAAYLSKQWADLEVVANMTDDLIREAQMIDRMVDEDMPFLRKYGAYNCKNCEYLDTCKPWLGVGGKND